VAVRVIYEQADVVVAGSTGKAFALSWLQPKDRSYVYVANDFVPIAVPSYIKTIAGYPRFADDARNGVVRLYAAGALTQNVVLDEHLRCHRLGIKPPTIVPNVTAVAGGAITGNFVPYYRFLDRYANRISPLSAPGAIVSPSAQARQWNNVPQTSFDNSVTDVQGLVDDGTGVARVAWTRELGGGAVLVDTTETLALGIAAPATFGDLPTCFRLLVYHDMLLGFGNDEFPERIFASVPGELEHWTGTQTQSDGEPVIGAFAANDLFMFGSFHKIYRLQGYTGSDLVRQVERPDMGLTGPDGVAIAYGRAIVPTTTGIFVFDGTWHPLLGERQEEWQRQLRTYPQEYFEAQGFFDREGNVYLFGPVPHTNYAAGEYVWWVLNCQHLFPESGGSIAGFRADWALDIMGRRYDRLWLWSVPGHPRPFLMRGGPVGFFYLANNEDAIEDVDGYLGGDPFQKKLIIAPGSFQPDIGGKRLDRLLPRRRRAGPPTTRRRILRGRAGEHRDRWG